MQSPNSSSCIDPKDEIQPTCLEACIKINYPQQAFGEVTAFFIKQNEYADLPDQIYVDLSLWS